MTETKGANDIVKAQKQRRIRKLTDKQIEEALYKSLGIVSEAIRVIKKSFKIDISRQALHSRIKKNEKLQQAQYQAREAAIDLCESVVFQAIVAGDSRLAFNVLCKIGKSRGYNDFMDTSEGEAVKIVFDIPNVEIPSVVPDLGVNDDKSK